MTRPVIPLRTGEGFTVEDWLTLPDDGLRSELVDGSLHVKPPPTVRHQLVVNRLAGLLRRQLPPGLTLDYTGAGVAPPDLGARRA